MAKMSDNSPRAAEADELRTGQLDAAFAPDADPSVSGSAREAPSDSGIGGRGEYSMFDQVMREFGYKKPLYPHWAEVVEVAIERERERCAKIADDTPDSPPYDPGMMRHLIAQRIRKRVDMSDPTQTTVTIPRDLLVRVYQCLNWICGEGLTPSADSVPDPDDLFMKIGAIINPEGIDATEIV